MRRLVLSLLLLSTLSIGSAIAAGTTTQTPGTETSFSCTELDVYKKCKCQGVSDCLKMDKKGVCDGDIECFDDNICYCDWKKKRTVRDRLQPERFDHGDVVAPNLTIRDHRQKTATTPTQVYSGMSVSTSAFSVTPQPPGTSTSYTCTDNDDWNETCTCTGFHDCKDMKEAGICKEFLGVPILACDDNGCSCDWVTERTNVRDHRKTKAPTTSGIASVRGTAQSITQLCRQGKDVKIGGRTLKCIAEQEELRNGAKENLR